MPLTFVSQVSDIKRNYEWFYDEAVSFQQKRTNTSSFINRDLQQATS